MPRCDAPEIETRIGSGAKRNALGCDEFDIAREPPEDVVKAVSIVHIEHTWIFCLLRPGMRKSTYMRSC